MKFIHTKINEKAYIVISSRVPVKGSHGSCTIKQQQKKLTMSLYLWSSSEDQACMHRLGWLAGSIPHSWGMQLARGTLQVKRHPAQWHVQDLDTMG